MYIIIVDNCTSSNTIIIYFIHVAAPKITVAPNDQTLLEGSSVSISCAFNGAPAPSVMWRRNGKSLEYDETIRVKSCPTSSVLEIVKVSYAHEGMYICTVSNSHGSDSCQMDMIVQGDLT